MHTQLRMYLWSFWFRKEQKCWHLTSTIIGKITPLSPENNYGKGQGRIHRCMTDEETLKSVYKAVLPEADVEIPEYHYPIIVRKGLNDLGKTVCYFLNYSGMELEMPYDYKMA